MVHRPLGRVLDSHYSFGCEPGERSCSSTERTLAQVLRVHPEQVGRRNVCPTEFVPDVQYQLHLLLPTFHRNVLAERICRLFRDPIGLRHLPSCKRSIASFAEFLDEIVHDLSAISILRW